MSFTKMNETAEVQFGNPTDTSGYKIDRAKILGRQQRMIEVFLVQDGHTFGIATRHKLRGMYYCTQAAIVGDRFNVSDVAQILGAPIDMIKEALAAQA